MKVILKLLAAALVGFVIAYLMLSTGEGNFIHSNTLVINLYAIVFIMLVSSYVIYRRIDKLNNKTFKGEEEDEVGDLKYRKFNDYSLLIQSSSILSILGVSIALSTKMNVYLIVIGMIYIIITYFLQYNMTRLMQKVYPERNLPDLSDPEYTEKIFQASDEGERYVMLEGLYKAYSLFNVLLVFAIVAATIYSMTTNNSQIFSIFLMSIVLFLTNGKYVLTIRNK